MNNQIPNGIIGNLSIKVTTKDTASQYGSGLIDVFATPAMIALMEKTAQCSVQSYLPEGSITLGTEINIKHIKATAVGMKVSCESKLISIEGRKLIFEVKAWDEQGEIGYGTHERCIVDSKKFMEKLANNQ
ncbi:MAG: thioesterase family protein [Bacteroidetes bacterium]|nr:thioesterase family protein [Bacteroidota bacterium]